MDGWMDGWMDACMHACMHACMDGWMDGWMEIQNVVLDCVEPQNKLPYMFLLNQPKKDLNEEYRNLKNTPPPP